MFSKPLLALATQVIARCTAEKLMLATAESCTGGLVAALLTEVSGASAVVDRGFVTYSNQAKERMLGVPAALITAHGAVSGEVAIAMATGALANSNAQLTLSLTGIAGPGGGTAQKPVGLVYIGCAFKDNAVLEAHYFTGTRAEIRLCAVEAAFKLALQQLAHA